MCKRLARPALKGCVSQCPAQSRCSAGGGCTARPPGDWVQPPASQADSRLAALLGFNGTREKGCEWVPSTADVGTGV